MAHGSKKRSPGMGEAEGKVPRCTGLSQQVVFLTILAIYFENNLEWLHIYIYICLYKFCLFSEFW